MLAIGALSRATGVKVPTIRYYEQEGLLPLPERTEGNQRRYGRGHVARLNFIRHARDLGLPMKGVRELVRLSAHAQEPCENADEIARVHLKDVRARIARLRRLEGELERITRSCEGGLIANCSVIASFSDHGMCEGEHGGDMPLQFKS